MTPRFSVLIRDAGIDDIATIVEFNLGLARETENKILDREILTEGVAAGLRDPERVRYWIAESEGLREPVGQAAITREWSDWRNGWIWWFQSVYVREDARGSGVFRSLYQQIRRSARLSGDVVGLRLYVEAENFRAQQVYVKLGFKPGGYHVYEEIWPERFGGRLRS